MNEEQALNKLKGLCDEHKDDIEYLHQVADDLLCDLLRDNYPELIKQYEAIYKWYA